MKSIIIEKVIKQRESKYLLLLSNGAEVLVHEDILVRYRLLAGKEIEAQLLQELDYEGEIQHGYSSAINYISYRPRSVFEVKEYLRRKEIAVEYIEDIISRLLDKGYLDDADFAQKWVDNRRRLNPKGKYVLRNELKEKGIAASIINDVLEAIDDEEEQEHALQIARKKLRQFRGKAWQDVRPKIMRFLTYKGFKMDVILKILPKIESELRELA